MRSYSLAVALAVLGAGACSNETTEEQLDGDADLAPARAGVVTEENRDAIVPSGSMAVGRPGDYFLRNDLATFIIQRPGRELALGPYGGSLVDVALAGGSDHFGELIPALAVGRTVRVDAIEVIEAGRDDASTAVLEASGEDTLNVYYNLEGVYPEVVSYIEGGGGVLTWDPDASLGMAVTIRYSLPADEARLTIEYGFENTSERVQPVPFATIMDVRGANETFISGTGFATLLTKSLDIEQIVDSLANIGNTEQALLVNDDYTLAFVPRAVNNKVPPKTVGAFVPGIGGALVFEVDSALGLLAEPSFLLAPGDSGTVSLDVLVAPTAQEVLESSWDLLGRDLVTVSGCVTHPDDSPAADVRVGLTHAELGTIAFYQTDAGGCFGGRVPAGDYTAVAGAPFREPSDEVAFSPPVTAHLVLPALGTIDLDVGIYDTLDASEPAPHPCRLTLAGERQMIDHPALGDAVNDDPGSPLYRMYVLRDCDQLVEASPGRYLAIVSRGPEFDLVEQVIEVTAGNVTRVTGALHRVVDSRGWAASDFHVHSVYSPDSSVPADQRVLSMAVEGMDFWASTDHDVVADYVPHIAALGLEAELLTVPGAEVTTFDTGHIQAYPLDRWDQANGGAPDWAPREDGIRPHMQELFDDIHGRGALIQINHPRGGVGGMGAYFTRANMRWHPETGAVYSDFYDLPVPSEFLRYPPDYNFFSSDFDAIEVMNGISTFNRDGMTYDWGLERSGHDWMNFLSWGRRMLAIGNSDTHNIKDQPGLPRTMVNGHDQGVTGLVTALWAGEIYVTTGPILRAELRDAAGATAGLGEVLSPSSSQVTLHVEAETPLWYDVRAVDVVANAFFEDPTVGDPAPSAVPLTPLVIEQVTRANGGMAQVGSADIPIDLSAAPFNGQDSWLIVRLGGGERSLFPLWVNGNGALDTAASTPEAFLSGRSGKLPFAFTNPIFVDLDGDGQWR